MTYWTKERRAEWLLENADAVPPWKDAAARLARRLGFTAASVPICCGGKYGAWWRKSEDDRWPDGDEGWHELDDRTPGGVHAWRGLYDRSHDWDLLLLLLGRDGDQVLLAKPRFQWGTVGDCTLAAPKVLRPETTQDALDAAQKVIWARRRACRSCVLCGDRCTPEDGQTEGVGGIGFVCWGCMSGKLGYVF